MSKRARESQLPLMALLTAFAFLFVGAKAIVNHSSQLYVTDQAGVISQADQAEILAIGKELERQTGAQLAVLTVSSLEGEDIEGYAHRTAEAWKLGQAGEDNGVLLLLALEERQSRIEVGYGLEGSLTDVMTGRIQDNYMLPHYREGDFSTGLREGSAAVASLVYQHYGMEAPETLPSAEAVAQAGNDYGGAAFSGLILILLFVMIFGRRRGAGFLPFLFFPPRGGGGRPGGFGGTPTGRGGGFGGGGSSRRF